MDGLIAQGKTKVAYDCDRPQIPSGGQLEANLPLSLSLSLFHLSPFCRTRMGSRASEQKTLFVDNSILRPPLWQAALLSTPTEKEAVVFARTRIRVSVRM